MIYTRLYRCLYGCVSFCAFLRRNRTKTATSATHAPAPARVRTRIRLRIHTGTHADAQVEGKCLKNQSFNRDFSSQLNIMYIMRNRVWQAFDLKQVIGIFCETASSSYPPIFPAHARMTQAHTQAHTPARPSGHLVARAYGPSALMFYTSLCTLLVKKRKSIQSVFAY